MKKKAISKVVALIKLIIPAGKANPSPPIGPALGQRGLNIMDFCKAFNADTQSMEPGIPVPVEITAYENKSFTYIIKISPVSYYLKKYANIDKGSAAPKKDPYIAKITMSKCEEIAKIKMKDLNANSLITAIKIIKGSAESMGLEVVED
ncbi:ribosomal protein L11 [Orientia chuto str. Dubai]|uniref:Large ribosomal subunit protein uL11 n=1 Tax=Orientia chuto str. Dubai TaxID=1359168 RepID=A0A0F3MPZ4_9RICK|nr:50S ribosomal protein L11 [Candidatus Orientia mediorientalis]KJV57532.1 ribosomal protein L11 [Orientia chuto str. Dubai]